MPYTPILGTLGYVFDRHSSSVLLVHRNRRPTDEHLGKWNGLGGKLEPGEDIASGMRREIMEETGLQITSMQLRGTISWPGFGANGEDWFGPIFLIDGWVGTAPDHNDEGDLRWIPLERLLAACDTDEQVRNAADLPMWEGDRHFVPLVFDNDTRVFHGVMPYANGKPQSWSFERC